MTALFGIPNCTTVQKAQAWLDSNQIAYDFHDYKKMAIDHAHLQKWCDKLGWEMVLNRQGMMWKKASDADKNKVIDQESAIEFMIKVPTSIKRPIIEHKQGLLRGFVVEDYERVFSEL